MTITPKLISVVGARPQFIKLAPLARVLSREFEHRIIHTGQHFDESMSEVFFRRLDIPLANINLGVHGGGHGDMTGRMMQDLEPILIREQPDMVIVYGDTNSTMAAALTASKLGIPVAHVEAGMRSFVESMPEEINRKVTDHVAKLHFCPTRASMKNLKSEGITGGIVYSGDLMYELLDETRSAIRDNRGMLKDFDLTEDQYILMTVHRAGNVDTKEQLEALFEIIKSLFRPVLFPMHPRTAQRIRDFNLSTAQAAIRNLTVVDPLDYLGTLTAAHYAHAVLTDSGGLQKEALYLGTPVLTLRNETEWTETLRLGNHLVGLNKDRISKLLARDLKTKPIDFRVKTKRDPNGQRPSEVMAGAIGRYLESQR